MLPNPGFGWKEIPKIQVWRKVSTDEDESLVKLESYGPLESPTVFEEALRHNEVCILCCLSSNGTVNRWFLLDAIFEIV